MAINTFSHAILSASLVSYPELAEGSGVEAIGSTAKVVSLTAGKVTYTPIGTGSDITNPGTNPVPNPGVGVVGIAAATGALSGTLGIEKLGAIGTHPVSQLLYTPPPRKDGTAGVDTPTDIPAGDDAPGGKAPLHTGTCLAKGYGNLNEIDGRQIGFMYELISPEDTETFSYHRPHLHHQGSTLVFSSLSGITVALRTSPAQATKSRHQRHGHHDSGIEVQYYLGDPKATFAAHGGLVVSAGLSSDHLGFVGPEHARRRLMGF